MGPARGAIIPVNPREGLRAWLGIYEIEIARYLKRLAPRGGTSYDIGAFFGGYSLALAALGGERVFAFEPDPERFNLLAATLRMNPSLSHRIQAHETELGRGDVGQSVDSFVAVDPERRKPSLLKIDVDGPEYDVLSGALQTLKDMQPRLIVEVHSFELEVACLQLIVELGYVYRVVNPQTVLPELRPIEMSRWIIGMHRSDPASDIILRKNVKKRAREPGSATNPSSSISRMGHEAWHPIFL